MFIGAGWAVAMPLGAGILRWVLAYLTIEEEKNIG